MSKPKKPETTLICPTCSGMGLLPPSEFETSNGYWSCLCPLCQGKGRVVAIQKKVVNFEVDTVKQWKVGSK